LGFILFGIWDVVSEKLILWVLRGYRRFRQEEENIHKEVSQE
jgi:hypothetical protein